MTNLTRAFHNDPVQKTKYVSIMQKASDENRLVSGNYWCESDSTGCLVGQITNTKFCPHRAFATDLNTPLWIPHVFDSIFEGLDDGIRQQFAVSAIKSIPVGFSNWDSLYHLFCLYNLEKGRRHLGIPVLDKLMTDVLTLHEQEESDEIKWDAVRARIVFVSGKSDYDDYRHLTYFGYCAYPPTGKTSDVDAALSSIKFAVGVDYPADVRNRNYQDIASTLIELLEICDVEDDKRTA